ncbi:MAG: SAM-dependent methyltransferase [Clostridia bacterium]|nr:SAM-dependent methyltransferase [Clostridia bacterium]
MGYGKRIDTLCALLKPVDTFADVGCDHGYCTEYMLENGLCKRAIFSDISKGSLKKAETLLAKFVADGVATPVLGDGFFGVPSEVDEVLIAGMGGSEMLAILTDKKYGFIPKRFVLQPMHDAEKLRRCLVENGADIQRDFTFFDGKYYDVIVGEYIIGKKKECAYTDAEFEFGKDNLRERGEAFLSRIQKLLNDTEKYLTRENLQEESRAQLQKRKERLQGVLLGAVK